MSELGAIRLIDFAGQRRWVAWRNEIRNGRPTKEPYCDASRRASHSDPQTWLTLSEAERLAPEIINGQGGGIGVMLGAGILPDFSLGGLDFDACRNPDTGEIAPWAEAVIAELGSYTEVSPSGTGAKVFFLYQPGGLPELRRHMGDAQHGKKWGHPARPGDNGHGPAIELHVSNRYFATTWQDEPFRPPGADEAGILRVVPLEALLKLVRETGPDFVRAARKPAEPPPQQDSGAPDPEVSEPPGGSEADELVQRIKRAGRRNPALARRWSGDWAGLQDQSGSARAFALGSALKRSGFSFADMSRALERHPDTRDWAASKGSTAGRRELRRIWDKTLDGEEEAETRPGRILPGADFIARHVPPVWLIDGIVQRSRLYACTSLTGHGKTAVWLFNACMVHAGRMIGPLDVFAGNVLFLAGENPSDLEARMIGMARAYNLPHDRLPYVLPGSFPMTEEAAEALRKDIAALGVPLAMIVGDTASSFFPGDDENSNVQAGGYARTLRTFAECDGNPAVVVLSHPTKNAHRGNLLPRGGGAFLNELDGNLALWSETPGEVTELHWCGKIRGPDFPAFGYRLRPVQTGLTDERDRPETTIIAEPMSEEEVAEHGKQALSNQDAVLLALRDHPGWSYAQIAREAGWVDDGGQPMRPRVQRAIRSLAEDKLVIRPRKEAPWEMTEKGEKALENALREAARD